MSDTQASKPQWLEYIYRTAHPVLRWLPTKLAEWIGYIPVHLSTYLVHTQYLCCCAALVQDTVLVVPQYPYCIEEDRHAVDLENCWTARLGRPDNRGDFG
jgi:hypothetical protein